MARVLHNLLFFLIRLALKIRVLGYWSLIYGYCALCTIVALLKLWWNIVLRPTTTFQWVIRETPPACLNDTSLGTHCYVRIKVRRALTHMHLNMKGGLVRVRGESPLCLCVRACVWARFSCMLQRYNTLLVSRREKTNRPDVWVDQQLTVDFSCWRRFVGGGAVCSGGAERTAPPPHGSTGKVAASLLLTTCVQHHVPDTKPVWLLAWRQFIIKVSPASNICKISSI